MSLHRRLSKRKAHKDFLWIEQGGLCAYCHRPMTKRPKCVVRQSPSLATIDHLHPKARGGTDKPSNMILSCLACNTAKADRFPLEFFAGIEQRKRA